MYIADGVTNYKCITFGRRRKYEQVLDATEIPPFINNADIYWYGDSLYLYSSTQLSPIRSDKPAFDYSTNYGYIVLPHSVEKKIAKLLRRGRLIFGSDGSEDK